ncbi:MAG TPA: 23S rRNA (pseudouridine(1915)-N(3))-methyltransferase RlmH [Candidatus Ozemobacteraceae bacterium]|nr:23S rRNA (pseudouridine(1915)-N(3))-methyltransferase RlmH [Candidatus Ozemobacteraceae bacterium]
MIGKIQERPYRSLVENYLSRCHGRLSVQLLPCRDDAELMRRFGEREWTVALDERGTTPDSLGFSQWLSGHFNAGRQKVSVFLGGSAGLPAEIKTKSRERLALSRLTLNHQLALLVFAEQLYRGTSILFGEPYHKA